MNIDERARRAAAAIREQAAATDADAVLERIRRERDRPGWLLPAGATAVAVAVVIAVVAVVLPRTDPGPVIDPVLPGDPTPDDEVSDPSTDEPPDDGETSGPPVDLAGAWERITSDTFGGPGDQRMAAVAGSGGALVAVGSDRESATVWYRPAEGGDWTRVATDLCGEASCELHDVTVTGDGFVVVGMLDGLPKIWRSEDGRVWRRVDLERRDPGTAGETELTAVVGLGPSQVNAFGAERLPEGGSRPVVFTSSDGGETWTEAPVDFAPEEAGAHVVDAGPMGAVLQIGDGTSLLVETDDTWAPRDPEGDAFDIVTTFVHAIAPAAEGAWMLGSIATPEGQDGRVWRSDDDGATWAPMPGDLGGPGDQHVTGVAIAGNVVVGYETDPGGGTLPAAWALIDGAWARVPGSGAFDDPGAMADAVQTDGHSAIVVGDTAGPEGAEDADAVVWTVVLEGS